MSADPAPVQQVVEHFNEVSNTTGAPKEIYGCRNNLRAALDMTIYILAGMRYHADGTPRYNLTFNEKDGTLRNIKKALELNNANNTTELDKLLHLHHHGHNHDFNTKQRLRTSYTAALNKLRSLPQFQPSTEPSHSHTRGTTPRMDEDEES